VFALQDEVVGGVVAELRRALGAGIEPSPRKRAVRPEVWALFVQGRAQLERCVTLDPDFAPGWTEFGRAGYYLHFFGMGEGVHLEQGLAHVHRALELDPGEPQAHLQLGQLLALQGESEAAIACGRRALELAPGRADLRVWFGSLLLNRDRNEEAIPILKNLTRLEPELRYMPLFQLALA
jgi:tetratricopeptide (TPR) repeat protein